MIRETDLSQVVSELADLLKEEHAAVLRADLARVADLSDRKTALVERLNQAAGPAPGLPRLRGQILRNQDLMRSAMAGIRTVAERLKRIRAARESLTVYGADGRAHRYEADRSPGFERRA